MQTTVVKFYAYSRPQIEVFLKGETMEEIHQKLHEKCNTYVPMEILQGELHNQALSCLTDLVEITQKEFSTILEVKKFVDELPDIPIKNCTHEQLMDLRIKTVFGSLITYNPAPINLDEYRMDSVWKTKQLARGRLYEVKCFLSLLNLRCTAKIVQDNSEHKVLIKYKSK